MTPSFQTTAFNVVSCLFLPHKLEEKSENFKAKAEDNDLFSFWKDAIKGWADFVHFCFGGFYKLSYYVSLLRKGSWVIDWGKKQSSLSPEQKLICTPVTRVPKVPWWLSPVFTRWGGLQGRPSLKLKSPLALPSECRPSSLHMFLFLQQSIAPALDILVNSLSIFVCI